MRKLHKFIAALLLSTACVSSAFSMGGDVVKSVHLCQRISPSVKNVTNIYMVTITENEEFGAGLFIDDWENLVNEELSYFLPIQNRSTFKDIAGIKSWMSKTFGAVICTKITEDEAMQEATYQRQQEARR